MATNSTDAFSLRENIGFVCLTPGTQIATPRGCRPIEALRPGDLIETLDNGPQELVWIGVRQLAFSQAPQSQLPIQFKAGCLGPKLPESDLIVSPHYKLLCRGSDGERLAAAKSFVPMSGVRSMKGKKEVTYQTLLFRRHEIIFANGVAVESFYPGPYALSQISPFSRLQIIARVPELLSTLQGSLCNSARPLLTHREALELAQNRQLSVQEFGRIGTAKSSPTPKKTQTASSERRE